MFAKSNLISNKAMLKAKHVNLISHIVILSFSLSHTHFGSKLLLVWLGFIAYQTL